MGGSRGKPLPLPLASTITSLQASAIGTYVYCVVRAEAEPDVAVKAARLPEAGAPRTVPLASRTWLVLADVPMGIYGSAALDQRLKDLEWIGAVGLAHQAMVDACLKHEAVVPMKVLTIFANVARAKKEMQRHADRLRAAMQQVAGCVEWGVRVTRAKQPARTLHRRETQPWMQPQAQALPQPQKQTPPAATGRAFLEAKVQHRQAVREETETLDRHLRTLADTLNDVTRDVRYRLEQPAGATVPVLLDAAYLVPRRSERQFRAQVRAKSQPLLARGCRVTVTGPWPAYSFVSPDGR
jgi:Gas vesicle synthesis protein GvpL/GvpF